MCSASRPGNDIRLRRTDPGVKRMADDSPAPPLTRRVRGAARGGPGSSTRRLLPDALLKRMQAAVDAARAGQSERTEQAAFANAATQPAAERAARPRERNGAGNQMRYPAGPRLAAPPARNGNLQPSAPPAGGPVPAQLGPPVEAPPARWLPGQRPPPPLNPPVLGPPVQPA